MASFTDDGGYLAVGLRVVYCDISAVGGNDGKSKGR